MTTTRMRCRRTPAILHMVAGLALLTLSDPGSPRAQGAAPAPKEPDRALEQAQDGADLSIELIDPKVLRVCSDPRNLPFSNEKGEGFENKLAELLAAKLQKKLDYTYFPQATGFVRVTLGAHRCDLIMGFPQGDDLVQVTNPYYRTAYALVAKADAGLDDVSTLSDPRLKGKHLGVVAGTPPATYMAANGLVADAKPYPLTIDTRIDSSAKAMIDDITSGAVDAGVLWDRSLDSMPSTLLRRYMSPRSPKKARGRRWSIVLRWACATPTRTGSGSSTA